MSAVRGDALHLPLPDESVDLIVTSPPYFALRSYRDEGEHYTGQIGSEETPQSFLEALWTATREMVRVLKPTGNIFVNLGDKYAGSGGHNNNGLGKSTLTTGAKVKYKAAAQDRDAPRRYNQSSGCIREKSLMGLPWRYAIGCIDDLGLILRAEIIWSKPNGLPESVTDRVRRSHEQWFHFVREPKYFSAVDEVREVQTHTPSAKSGIYRADYHERSPEDLHIRDGRRRMRLEERPGLGVQLHQHNTYNPLGKLPGSVWTIPSEPLKVPAHLGIDHFAAFPQEWPRRLILGWSPNGVCVECGEGRRPVVEKQGTGYRQAGNNPDPNRVLVKGFDTRVLADPRRNLASHRKIVRDVQVEVTGYACACPEPTADTKPAVIADVFGGTGTVALVARALGRIGISVDLSMDYCRLAKWRISQPASKVLSRTWHERQGELI